MSTTLDWLEGYNSGQGAALSMVVEGFGTVFATSSMPGTYSADSAPYSQWPDPRPGLRVSGTLTGGIKLYTPDIEPDTVTVTIADTSSILISQLFRENSSAGHTTFLTANLLAGNDHTEGSGGGIIAVKSTTGFAASGTIYVGGDAISYTGKTASTFTGCARGVYALNQTNAGQNFAPSHLIGNNVVVSARTAPAVTDYPRTWYGRFVHVFLHLRDPLTGNYNLPSLATKIVSGRIEGYRDDGEGNVSITVKTALDLLYRQVGPDQWHASLNAGFYFASDQGFLFIERSGGITAYGLVKNLALSGVYTHEQLAAKINDRFVTNTWDTFWAGHGTAIDAGDKWRLEFDSRDGGPPRYRILVSDSGGFANDDTLTFSMSPAALSLLGFVEAGADTSSTSNGYPHLPVKLHRVLDGSGNNNYFEAIAPKPPILYFDQTPAMQATPATMAVTDEVNTFVAQGASDFLAWPDSNGVVQVNGGAFTGGVYAVKYTHSTPSTIVPHAILNAQSGYFWNVPTARDDKPVRVGDGATDPPTVKQVFYYRGPAGQLLLNMLLSTGGSVGYNHATYDTLQTAGFGVSVPASLVDIPSWQALDDVQVAIVVSEPKPFYEYLEPILAVSGRYVVWKTSSTSTQPKLTIVRPSLESAYQATWQLTESNKCDNSRTQVDRALDGIINRVVVKYGSGINKTEPPTTLTVEDIPSQTDYGRRRTVTIDAGPVINVPEIASQAIAPALAYFARPVATAERSYNASLFRMAPGDSATLVDDSVVDAAAGTRGCTLYCWVLNTRFDLASGKGTVRVVFLPEKNVNYTGKWAPSARVDETAGGGGYSGDVSKILTLKNHEFTESTAALKDAEYFNTGDKVFVQRLDVSPVTGWADTIASRTATTITLTTGSGGTFDSTKRYVVTYDDYTTVGAGSQRNSAFNAVDPATIVPTAYEWGHRATVTIDRTPIYSQGMIAMDAGYYGDGEPVSVHLIQHVARGANAILGYRSRSVHVNEYLGDLSVTGTTDTIKFMAWVPFYGHAGSTGTRGLKVRVRGKQAGGGTATFTVASSPRPPLGTGFTGFTFPTGKQTAVITMISSTNVWSSETDLAGAPTASGPGGMFGTWITVYSKGSGGGITATFNQLFVCEAGL